jgi:hypothetical protein
MATAKKKAPRQANLREAIRKRRKLAEGLRETEFLLSSPKNAARLRAALAQAKAGKLVEHGLDE